MALVLIVLAALGLAGLGVWAVTALGGRARQLRLERQPWFDAAVARLGWEATPAPATPDDAAETLAWPERHAQTTTPDGWTLALRITGWRGHGEVVLTCAPPPDHAPLQALSLHPTGRSALAHHPLPIGASYLISALLEQNTPPHKTLLGMCNAWGWPLKALEADGHHITMTWALVPDSIVELWLGDDLDARVARAATDGEVVARALAARLSRPEGVAASLRHLYEDARLDEGVRLVALHGLLSCHVPAQTDAALLHIVHHPDPLAMWAVHEHEPQLLDAPIVRLLLRTLGHKPLSGAQLLAALRLIAAHATPALIDEADADGHLSERLLAQLSAPHPLPLLHTLTALITEDLRPVAPTRWIIWLSWLAVHAPDFGEASAELADDVRAEITDHALATLPPDHHLTLPQARMIRLLGWTGDPRALPLLATLRASHQAVISSLADAAHLRLIDRLGRVGLTGSLQLADTDTHGALSLHERAGEIELLPPSGPTGHLPH